MTLTTPNLNITYSDYNYLINLFKDEFNNDKIISKKDIDYILNFSQSPTTNDFFQQILKESVITIPTDSEISQTIKHLTQIKLNLQSSTNQQSIQEAIAKLNQIKQSKIDQRNLYFQEDFDFLNQIEINSNQFEIIKLKPITYEEFIDNITNVPMQLMKQSHSERN